MSTPIRFVAPLVSRLCTARVGGRGRIIAAALLAVLSLSEAHAGGICATAVAGDNQTVVQGSRVFSPLHAQMTNSFMPTVSTETFSWASNSGSVFFSNGQTTRSSTETWVFNGSTWTVDAMESPYIGTNTPVGQVTITADSDSCLGAPPSFTINVAALISANAVMWSGDGSTIPAGGSVSLWLHATHENGNGAVLDATNVPFIYTVQSGPGSFSSVGNLPTTKQYTDGGGFAYPDLFIDSSAVDGQTVVVSAQAPGYPAVPFTITVGTPPPNGTLIIHEGDGQQLQPQSVSDPIVFQLVGPSPARGRGIVTTARVEVISGDATILESGSTVYDSSDNNEDTFHDFRLLAGSTPGPIQVRITAFDVAPGTVTANIIAPPPAPTVALEIVSGNNQSAQIGTSYAQPLVARLPAAPAPAAAAARAKAAEFIEFRVTRGSAVFVSNNQSILQVPVDPATGEASSGEVRNGVEVGAVEVTASNPAYAPAVFNLTATAPGANRTLTAASVPGLGTTGFDSAPLIVVLTEGGNAVAGATIHWQVVSGDATVNSNTSTTDANGRAQITVHYGNTPGAVLVRARETGSVSTDFQLQSADPTLNVVSGNDQSGPIGTTTDQPIVFELNYADGSPIAGQVISFVVVGDGTPVNSTATTDTSGRAGVTVRFGQVAGSIKVDAFALSNRIVAYAAASSFVPQLTIASGNNQTATAGTALPHPLVVKVAASAAAALTKGLAGLTVNWRITCGGGTLNSATTQTNSQGESSNTLTLGPAPGCNGVEAAITGVGQVAFTATGTIPSNSVLEIVSGNGQALIPGENSDPLKVRLRSAAGTPLSGITISFAANRSQVVLTPIEVVTASDGTASTIAQMVLPIDFQVTARVRDISSITPVTFSLGAGLVNLPNLPPEQARVAEAIDNGCPALAGMSNLTPGQADLLARCTELVVNADDDPGDVGGALKEMLADEATTQNTTALAASNLQLDNIKSRFAALRAGSRGVDMNGLAILAPGGALPLSLLPSAIALAAGEPPEEVGSEFSRWGFFATGTIGRGDRDPVTLDPGFEYDSYGLTAGVDYRATESWILGAALGFNRNNTELREQQGGLDAKGWNISGYASFFEGSSWYADAVLTFGRNNYDIDRRIDYSIDALSGGTTVVDQIASASPDGNQQSLALSVGRDFSKGAWTFGPYLRAAYTKLEFDAYNETMSNPNAPGSGLALSVDARELKSLQGVLGGKLSYAMSTSWGVLLPNLQVEWVQEFEDDPELMTTRFLHDPTQTTIVIDGERIDDSFFNLGFGLSGVFASGRSAYLYYEHVAGQERMSSDSLAIGVRIEF